MLEINHAICPECSIGCGINIISKDGNLIGINPYKNHLINEGKNCKNCMDNINNLIENNQEKSFDYTNKIDEIINKIKDYPNNEVTIITSGKTDNQDLEKIIKFADKNNYNLIAYEYNFTKTDKELMANYSEVEESDQIISIGDIYRNNTLIARRIIHAQEKDNAKTININTNNNLTGYNSDEFIRIDSYDNLIEVLEKIELTEKTVILINETINYDEILEFVRSNDIKILPLLKYPNSYSILENIDKVSKQDIDNTIKDSKLLIFINADIADYDEFNITGKEIISITPQITGENTEIPVKIWCEKEGSFTNSEGLTQEFTDAIMDENNKLKTVGQVLELICNK